MFLSLVLFCFCCLGGGPSGPLWLRGRVGLPRPLCATRRRTRRRAAQLRGRPTRPRRGLLLVSRAEALARSLLDPPEAQVVAAPFPRRRGPAPDVLLLTSYFSSVLRLTSYCSDLLLLTVLTYSYCSLRRASYISYFLLFLLLRTSTLYLLLLTWPQTCPGLQGAASPAPDPRARPSPSKRCRPPPSPIIYYHFL